MEKLQGNNTNHIIYIFKKNSLKIQFVVDQSHVGKNCSILSIIFLVQNSIKIKEPNKKDKKKLSVIFYRFDKLLCIVLVEAPSM